jgi:DNA polymerase-3 subunit gamma/tau
MSQAFYRKWRPRSWEAVVGQEHVIQTLRNAVATDRVAHAYLLAGPRGTGKTTTARLLAKAVNCLEPDLAARPCNQCAHCQAVNAGRFLDLIEIDAASNTSVEDVRDLRDKINFSPNQGRFKVYVIDEVHMLSMAAFNALLKTLEEPPAHAIFILATTEVHKIPATVLSRCQRHEFRRIPTASIVAHLQEMAAGEEIQAEPEALALIARQSTGSLRDAVSLLDQLASTGEAITLALAQSVLGTAASQAVLEMIDALVGRDPATGLDRIHQALDAGSDPRQFARQAVEYLRDLLLIRMGNARQVDATAEVRAQMARHAQAFTTPSLLSAIQAYNRAASEARSAWQPSLPLEMAFIESIEVPAEAHPEPSAAGQTRSTPALPQASAQAPARTRPQPPEPAQPGQEPGELEAESNQEASALNQNWPQILHLVRKQSPNTYGLLNSCKARHLKGNVLILGFASDVLKNQMNKPENLSVAQQVLAQVMGADIIIRCEISTARRTAIPKDVDQDGLVAAALRDLGGEIVDIQ